MIDCNSRLKVARATILSSLVLIGCGDFAHTNPLDRMTPVGVEVTGPDSAFSYFDTVSFVAHTLPSYAPEVVTWTSSGRLELIPLGNGRFYLSSSQTYQAAAETVWVELDGRLASHVLTFVHRPTSVRVADCVNGAHTASMDAFGQSRTLCLSGWDARGFAAPVGTPTLTASDPSVVDVVLSTPVVIRAVGNGTSVLRFSVRAPSDSVTVTVRQRIADVRLNLAACPLGYELAVGDTVQVWPTSNAFDPNGHPIADTARVRAAVATMSFGFGFVSSPSVSVSPDGRVIALQPGWATIVGFATTAAEGTVQGVCSFHVH